MKKLVLIGLMITCLIGAVYAIESVHICNRAGWVVEPGQVHTARNTWVAVDTTSSDGDEPNDLAVSERTYATVSAAAEGGDDEITVYSIPTSWNTMRLRCIGITNDQSIVHQIYLGTLGIGGTDCELNKAGQLTWTIGTQVSATATYELADSIAATDTGTEEWDEIDPDDNTVAEAKIALMGADTMVIVTTTAGCNAQLLAKGY